MNKFEETYQEFRVLRDRIRKECVEYLTDVVKAYGEFPLADINRDGCDECYVSIVYDGGRHPEYASNAYSDVSKVFLNEKGIVCVDIEDCEKYEIDRWENEDVLNVAWAVSYAIDYICDSLLSLIGVETTVTNGVWAISREGLEKLRYVVEHDSLGEYFEDDDAADLEEYQEWCKPKAMLSLIERFAVVINDEVKWEWNH